MHQKAKGLVIEIAGWLLIVIGIAGLVLPGPGLLTMFAGMVLLATRYEWAERRLEPLEAAAMRTARQSVASMYSILVSILGVLVLISLGVVWGLHPPTPGWWPLSARLWLPGGWSAGSSFIISGLLALTVIVYSFKRFRQK